MDRRTFLFVSSLGALSAPLAAGAQPAGKVFRIGYLASVGSFSARSPAVEAFRQGLRELGWVEGQNIVIEYRTSGGRFERLPDLAVELARLKVDVIVAPGTQAALAAKNATTTIPVVMIAVAEPVAQGLIAGLARPGGNVTGLSYSVGTEIFGKELELLKEAAPKARQVAVIWNPANPAHGIWIKEIKVPAQSLGVQLQLLEARRPDDFDGAFAAMVKKRAGALLVGTEAAFSSHLGRLAGLAARNRLPSVYGTREYPEAGGLMSYGPNTPDLWRRSAGYVDKILKGAKPAGLPVEQPTKFELVINLKTAKALGLTPALLQRADELIP